jgi:CHAT domain-containing protein/tetratricopeptide (TPR) repeat protein
MTAARGLAAAALSLACVVGGCSGGEEDVAPAVSGPVAEVRAALDRGAYADAEQLARAALDTLRAAGGDRSLEAGELSDALLIALARGGKASAPDAAVLAEQAVDIKREVLGPRHPSVATSLDNAGWLHFVRGEYERAGELYADALAILDSAAAADPEHRVALATVHSHLGPLNQELGQFSTARSHYERALDTFIDALGPGASQVAMSRNNLATLLVKVGDYTPALALYRESLTSLEGQLGSEHPLIATSKHNQAELQQRLGRFDEAVELYRQSLETKQRTLGPEHPSLALTLGNLSYLYTDRGDPTAADTLAERAVAIHESAYGAEHVDVAYSLVSLGRAQSASGDPAGARSSLERALELRTRALGSEHPLLVAPLHFLSQAVERDGDATEALELALRAEAIARAHLRLTARGAPDRQALRYAAERFPSLDMAISLASRLGDAAATTSVWDALIRSRAVVLDEMATRQRLANEIGTPAAQGTLDAYRAAAERLSNVLLRGPGPDVARYGQLLDELRAELEDAERAVAALSEANRIDIAMQNAGFDDVRDAMPANAVLVAYARVAPGGAGSPSVGEYVAFVLDDRNRPPRVVGLGPAREVETAIRRWRDEMVPEAPARDANGHVAPGARLRELLWDPLEIDAAGDRLILLVPDGAIHLVNFAALPVANGRALAEVDVLTHQLSSERDLLIDARPPARQDLLAMGGVQPGPGTRSTAPSPTGASSGCFDVSRAQFPFLAGSLDEVRGVASIWDVTDARPAEVLTGPGATEAAFKREAIGKSVVHLATHGFFSANDCWTDPATGTSPLQLSGLVFTAEGGSPESDGVLLAEEVATLDFSAARWVVLSGCDTGLGSIQVDEGILGLRRAFRTAGAGTVIMSLWPVEDVSADAFMQSLYRARFDELRSTAASMRQAYRDALIATRRERGHAHPLYWAPFIASGDWR